MYLYLKNYKIAYINPNLGRYALHCSAYKQVMFNSRKNANKVY